MAFFLIVPSVIIVTIFLVHSVAERLRFKVKYFSLILCAVMALLVNFAAIEMSTYLDKWHYVKLGVLVLFASIFVTLVNRYLIRHEKSDVVVIDDIEDELALEEAVTEDKVVKAVEPAANNLKQDKEVPPIPEDVKPKIFADDKPYAESKIEANSVKTINKTAEEIKVNKSETKPDIKKVEKPIKIQQTDTKVEVTTNNTKEIKVASKERTEEIKQTLSIKQDKAQPKEVENKTDKNLTDIDSHLGSLDDILDYAYAQKTKGDLKQSILAYQKALDKYQNDDYAPFIAIDLGNIYKEQAAYSKVIKTYEEALKLPVVMRNADNRREFTKNLTYMRIVQSVLVRHRALTIPFSKIPKQYLQEVESEFKAMQLNTSSSRRNF